MNRSDLPTPTTQDTALNGARVLGSRPKRPWAAERTAARGRCQHAGAWMHVVNGVP